MGSQNLLLYGVIIFFILPVCIVSLYVYAYGRKQQKLLNLFQKIRNNSDNNEAQKSLAQQAISILHGNKKICPPQPLQLDINTGRNEIIAYHLLLAEIEYLIGCIEKIRSQKMYLAELAPHERSNTLKFISQVQKTKERIIISEELPYKLRIALLIGLYQAAIRFYLKLPDEKNHEELIFFPLFQIVDRAPTRTTVLFPLFLNYAPPE